MWQQSVACSSIKGTCRMPAASHFFDGWRLFEWKKHWAANSSWISNKGNLVSVSTVMWHKGDLVSFCDSSRYYIYQEVIFKPFVKWHFYTLLSMNICSFLNLLTVYKNAVFWRTFINQAQLCLQKSVRELEKKRRETMFTKREINLIRIWRWNVSVVYNNCTEVKIYILQSNQSESVIITVKTYRNNYYVGKCEDNWCCCPKVKPRGV